MPIKIPDSLPAKEILLRENIFVMDESRAFHQDIRALKIAILNLMPLKQITEVQILRLIGNTPLQLDVRLIHMETHQSKNTSAEYLSAFYQVFDEIRYEKFDGMIITGAPVEHLPFEEVSYWTELTRIMDWTETNVVSTFYICWGALAGLYYHHHIPKHLMPSKMFGVFPHYKSEKHRSLPLLRGFDDIFYVPHSRHTEVRRADIEKNPNLVILSESEESGVYLVISQDGKQIFVTGHSEYDSDTLQQEYLRDLSKQNNIQPPLHYFVDDDPEKKPLMTWRSHANLLFSNWIHYVYQITPFDTRQIPNLMQSFKL